eukprot:CAMPEP_0117422480 /NCGR_PEP_ID=MMETSP0758-20121206/3303_1 /TAXON_ID=63605 /ORGANISM="Percolomonas cosmopolitus, Strain AE-1 (ATCC 50343)" /LENGTH=637 /DNA_ID=CAMNT_0005205109 /DNA_START=109 /DNA_END=2022 /DNA_ORIENTATION=+
MPQHEGIQRHYSETRKRWKDKQKKDNVYNEKGIISTKEELIVQRERTTLNRLCNLIESLEENDFDEDITLLRSTIQSLEEMFLLVVVGEFNSGKSSFVNALVGEKILKEGRTPTTTYLQLIRYKEHEEEDKETIIDQQNKTLRVYLDKPWLRRVSVVDTPGTNAIDKSHQALTEHFIPKSDLILFVLSADRPLSESERALAESIREWGKKTIVLINKCDLLNEQEQEEVIDFVDHGIQTSLNYKPEIYCISAQQAYTSKANARQAMKNASVLDGSDIQDCGYQWDELESKIFATLNSNERLRIKMESPLGIMDYMNKKLTLYLAQLNSFVREDVKTLDTIQQQLVLHAKDMASDYKQQQEKLDLLFDDLIHRGEDFFDDTFRIQNASNLWHADRVAEDFDRNVLRTIVPEIERHINELIDWMIDKNYKQWKAITDFAYERAKASSNDNQLVGSIRSGFDFNRKDLLHGLTTAADPIVRAYDRKDHVDKLSSEIKSSLRMTTLMGLTGLVTGGSTLWLANSIAMTLGVATGGLALSAGIGIGALGVLPYKRNKLKSQFRKNVQLLRAQLNRNLEDRFTAQLNENVTSIKDAISPYTRYVETKLISIERHSNGLLTIEEDIRDIRRDIQVVFDQTKESL